MILFSCSITKETAVFSKLRLLIPVCLLVCFVRVSYPFCYSLVSQEEDAREIRLFFSKNDFFSDCTRTNNKLVQTDKQVLVYLDGNLYQNKDVQKICD